jgi:hypothetical protein
MKVRAKQFGYYNLRKVRAGTEFELRPVTGFIQDKTGKLVKKVFSPEEQFSSRWMEKLEAEEEDTPKPVSKGRGKSKAQADGDSEGEPKVEA